MNPFQAMASRIARSVMAGMSPSERKKMIMDIYKRFKGQGDASIKSGRHQVTLAAEGYDLVVLEDAEDEELNRIYAKYDVANWLKKFGKRAADGRVADDHSVRKMQEAAANLNKASGRLIDAEGYMGGTTTLLEEALEFIKAANADISDADTEDMERELNSLIRTVNVASRSIANQIRDLRVTVKNAREQYMGEIDWNLQHPND